MPLTNAMPGNGAVYFGLLNLKTLNYLHLLGESDTINQLGQTCEVLGIYFSLP